MSARWALIAALAVLTVSGAPAGARAAAPAAAGAFDCPDVGGAVTRADVACALRRWFAMANTRRPQAVTALYARTDVLLLSTLQGRPLTTEGEIGRYFEALVTKPDFEVVPLPTLPDDKIDLFGGGGVDSGFYEFRWTKNRVREETPARFTFVFVLDRASHRLLIATHHSSKIPTEHAATGRR
jgi:hypothetical protein